jgi:type IV pilus assembly protein PilA
MATVGAIGRAVHGAATRDFTSTEVLAFGESSTVAGATTVSQGKGKGATVTSSAHGLCSNAQPVPSSMSQVRGKKYQPDRRGEVDYNTGDTYTGWRCLRFAVDEPQYYQYHYKVGGPPVNVKLPQGGMPQGLSEEHSWVASAQGDLDGDGHTSWFALQGYITDSLEIVTAPAIGSDDEEE